MIYSDNMKLKTLDRFVGAVNAGVGATVGSLSSASVYSFYSGISSENISLEYKIFFGTLMLPFSMAIPISTLLVADGVYDIYRGTHHYLGCRIWQKLTRNSETKKRIDDDLALQLIRIEKDV